MPRPRRIGAPEPKKRSRHGCWPCKRRKVKCGEEKPCCLNCQRQGDACDYGIRLTWGGRVQKKMAAARGPLCPSPTHNSAAVISSYAQEPDRSISEHLSSYGYDSGQPDVDIPRNHDALAIRCIPPIQITIPKQLEPLPALLLENPMNLMYFHHFLNHTAKCLVPHDCEQNPFRTTLPHMALRDRGILGVLLAFAASHRARLLHHPEPANRIALWVQDVFPKLREIIDAKPACFTDEILATVIMLASLEIISPNTFEVAVPWQSHLQLARQIMISRTSFRKGDGPDPVTHFLCRWFAYLDVLGSLSGRKNHRPLSSSYWSGEELEQEAFEIDCFLGFTGHCIETLAKIAELAQQCEGRRLDEVGKVRLDRFSTDTAIAAADELRWELQRGRRQAYSKCQHELMKDEEGGFGAGLVEMYATNEMFYWAGLIHLCRRVIGKSPEDAEVQLAVREIMCALQRIRKGSTAEACLLFPMFAAGCNSYDGGHREEIMERLERLEKLGIAQIGKARLILQEVWDTGKPWELLVSGEFLG